MSGRCRSQTGSIANSACGSKLRESRRERLFRRVSSAGKAWGDGVTEKLAWHVVKEFAAKAGVSKLAPHDLRRSLCPTLSRCWRRTGADPIPPRAHLGADDGAVPWLHATNCFCSKRQNRNRTRALNPGFGRVADDKGAGQDQSPQARLNEAARAADATRGRRLSIPSQLA